VLCKATVNGAANGLATATRSPKTPHGRHATGAMRSTICPGLSGARSSGVVRLAAAAATKAQDAFPRRRPRTRCRRCCELRRRQREVFTNPGVRSAVTPRRLSAAFGRIGCSSGPLCTCGELTPSAACSRCRRRTALRAAGAQRNGRYAGKDREYEQMFVERESMPSRPSRTGQTVLPPRLSRLRQGVWRTACAPAFAPSAGGSPPPYARGLSRRLREGLPRRSG